MRTGNIIARVVGAALIALPGAAMLPASPAWAQFGGNGDTSVTRRPYANLEGKIFTDRTNYTPGRAVQVTLSLENLTNQRRTFATGQNREYDISVKDGRSGKIVYRLSNHRNIRRGLTYTLQGNDSKTIRELWDQRDDRGNRVPTGVYIVEGSVWPQGTASTQIFIAEGDDRPGRPDRPDRPGRPDDPDRPGRPGEPGRPTPGGSLNSTLQVDRTRVQPGDTVSLTYTIANRSDVPLIIPFASGKRFDMTATGPQGRQVWQQSEGMMYTQALGQIQIGPGQRQTFTARWQVDRNARPGSYQVLAFLTPRGNASKAPAVANIVVGGGGRAYNDGNPAPGNVVVTPAPGAVHIVGPRALAGPQGRSFIGQRVTVSGVYQGRQGGDGAPPSRRADWVLAGEGVTLYVSGNDPASQKGAPVTVTGYVRQTQDGRLYIDAG